MNFFYLLPYFTFNLHGRYRFLVVLREPKVADLDEPITREEDVDRFDVAVEKPFGVDVVELEAYLREVT